MEAFEKARLLSVECLDRLRFFPGRRSLGGVIEEDERVACAVEGTSEVEH